MNLTKENIKNIIQQIVEKNGFFLIDLIARGNPKSRVFEVFIDSEKDVSAEDCASISREINSQIESIIESSYRLDVSSPGVDRPLKFLKQYPKNINRKFELSYTENNKQTGEPGETKKLVGVLRAIDGDDLVFVPAGGGEKRINFNNIKKAKVTVSFS